VEDLKFAAPRAPFERVRELSERGVQAYESLLGPWVRAAASPWTSALLKWFHPMRASRWMFSGRFNPWMAGVAAIAPSAAEQRRPAAPDNPFVVLEREVSGRAMEVLERAQRLRDSLYESTFRFWFGTGMPGAGQGRN